MGVFLRPATTQLEDIWAYIGTLQSCKDKKKLKWWYKLAISPEDRYSKQLFNQEWNIKPHRGWQRKLWESKFDGLLSLVKEYVVDV